MGQFWNSANPVAMPLAGGRRTRVYGCSAGFCTAAGRADRLQALHCGAPTEFVRFADEPQPRIPPR